MDFSRHDAWLCVPGENFLLVQNMKFSKLFKLSFLYDITQSANQEAVFNKGGRGVPIFFPFLRVYRDAYTFMYDIGGLKEQHLDAFDAPKKVWSYTQPFELKSTKTPQKVIH